MQRIRAGNTSELTISPNGARRCHRTDRQLHSLCSVPGGPLRLRPSIAAHPRFVSLSQRAVLDMTPSEEQLP